MEGLEVGRRLILWMRVVTRQTVPGQLTVSFNVELLLGGPEALAPPDDTAPLAPLLSYGISDQGSEDVPKLLDAKEDTRSEESKQIQRNESLLLGSVDQFHLGLNLNEGPLGVEYPGDANVGAKRPLQNIPGCNAHLVVKLWRLFPCPQDAVLVGQVCDGEGNGCVEETSGQDGDVEQAHEQGLDRIRVSLREVPLGRHVQVVDLGLGRRRRNPSQNPFCQPTPINNPNNRSRNICQNRTLYLGDKLSVGVQALSYPSVSFRCVFREK
mmetsp:Transcript_1309/g.2304  ORF Transcript_1309/g.2304 Transcript_1309/m.2304 type:complete len:268 (+) Transcript_1309:374-1177(+)